MNQLTLTLPLPASIRELVPAAIAESPDARDRRMVGLVMRAVGGLNRVLGEAAGAGYDVSLVLDKAECPGAPRRWIVRARVRRLAVDAWL